MSPRSRSPRGPGLVMSVVVCLLPLACSPEEYALRQPIEMGPWTFEAEQALARMDIRGQDRYRAIEVSLRLHNYLERHEKSFDDFLNGTSPGSGFAHPHLDLVDEQGNRFDGWVTPRSGGSLRSARWRAEFLLVPLSFRDVMSSQSASEQAAKFLDKQASHFKLVIENPDRRAGQPRRVAIQLRSE